MRQTHKMVLTPSPESWSKRILRSIVSKADQGVRGWSHPSYPRVAIDHQQAQLMPFPEPWPET